MKKICNICKTEKEFSEFSINKACKDGRSTRCRSCMRDWYLANRSRIQEKTRYRRKTEQEHYREIGRRYREANPDKRRANQAVLYAIRIGKLPPVYKQQCATCGVRAQHYHHWSYEQENWLSVVPVCISCHGRIHSKDLTIDDSMVVSA